jgi:hypothetical protein
MRKSAQTVTQRGQSRPPSDLARFIDLVNEERLYERELADTQEALYAAMDDPGNASASPRSLWIRKCEAIADQLNPGTRAFLGPASDLQQFLDRYELLTSAGQVLLHIARQYGSRSRPNAEEIIIRDARFPGVEAPFSVTVNVGVNDEGVLRASDNPLLAALIGVRADRIRACAICGRIFWASRANSECCSETCRKNYNQRNSRLNRRFHKRKRR